MDCSPPGSSVHGIFQARALEWVAISFSRGSSQPRDRTRVSHIAGRRFTVWATREAHFNFTLYVLPHPPPGGMEVSREKNLYWTEERGGHQSFLNSTGSWWKQCFLKVNFLYTDYPRFSSTSCTVDAMLPIGYDMVETWEMEERLFELGSWNRELELCTAK